MLRLSQFGGVRFSEVRLGAVRFDSVRFGSVRFDYGRVGLVSVWFGLVRFGSIRFGSVRFGSVRFGSIIRFELTLLALPYVDLFLFLSPIVVTDPFPRLAPRAPPHLLPSTFLRKPQLAEAVVYLQPLISVSEAMRAGSSSVAGMAESASDVWDPSQSLAAQVGGDGGRRVLFL